MTGKGAKSEESTEGKTFVVCSLGLSKEGSDVRCIRPVECARCPGRSRTITRQSGKARKEKVNRIPDDKEESELCAVLKK